MYNYACLDEEILKGANNKNHNKHLEAPVVVNDSEVTNLESQSESY